MGNKVYLVGAGPGEPSLITVRALEILRRADTVIYDYLVDSRILAEAGEGAELISCDTLGKKRYSDGFSVDNEKVNRLVIKKFKEGRKVVRLKSGDISIFGRTSQEIESLIKTGIPYELVPGVTAASGAASFSGIPLTDRRYASSCAFVTGHEDPSKNDGALDWKALARIGTLVLYMSVESLPTIARKLIAHGKKPDTPAAIIQDATLLTHKIVKGTLTNIVNKSRKEKIRPPAVVIVGDVVRLEKDFNWLKKTRKILFTGISERRFFQDEFVFHLPLVNIVPLKDYRLFDRSIADISGYDWLVFSSRYGVQYFFQRLNHIGLDSRSLAGVRIAAIGNSTANKLLEFGMVADLIPKDESSKGLQEAFNKIDLKQKRVFIPRSDLSDKGLVDGLVSQGARVAASVAYKNIMPEGLPEIDFKLFDEIRFSSPSGVRNFMKRYGRVPRRIKISCIGKVTEIEATRSMGRAI